MQEHSDSLHKEVAPKVVFAVTNDNIKLKAHTTSTIDDDSPRVHNATNKHGTCGLRNLEELPHTAEITCGF